MPRPASKFHPLREIRNILGLSQVELAKRVGCKAVTIKKIEAGTLNPGVRLARKLAAETHVSPNLFDQDYSALASYFISEGVLKQIPGGDGKPLTLESHQKSIEGLRMTPQKEVDFTVKIFSMMIQVLLDASLESAQPKILHVTMALMDALDEIKADFGLDPQVKQILPLPYPSRKSWASWVRRAAEAKAIPLKLDPLARRERYRKRRETIKLKKGESPKKPSRPPLLPGSGNA